MADYIEWGYAPGGLFSDDGLGPYLSKRPITQIIDELREFGFGLVSEHFGNPDQPMMEKRVWVAPHYLTLPQAEYLLERCETENIRAVDFKTEEITDLFHKDQYEMQGLLFPYYQYAYDDHAYDLVVSDEVDEDILDTMHPDERDDVYRLMDQARKPKKPKLRLIKGGKKDDE